MVASSGSEYVLDCFDKVGQKGYVCQTLGGQLEGRLLTTPGTHQNRAHARGDGGLQVTNGVADEPRAGQIQLQFAASLQQQAGAGLAAFTGVIRGVWTEIERVDAATGRVDSFEQVVVCLGNGFRRHQSAPDCGLVGDNHDGMLGLRQSRKRRKGGREDVQLLGAAHVIAAVLVDYAVSVKKHCAAGTARRN